MTFTQAIIFGVLSAIILYGIVKARRAAEISADAPPTRLEMARVLGLLITGMGIFLIVMCGAIIVFSNVAHDASAAADDAKSAVATAEAERVQRVDTVSNFFDVLCQTNNAQDATLGDLVQVSIQPQNSFGEDVDPSILTPFDLQVIATIAKLSQASEDSPLTAVFQQTLDDLRDLTPCHKLVETYRHGGQINVADILGPAPPSSPDKIARQVGHAISEGADGKHHKP